MRLRDLIPPVFLPRRVGGVVRLRARYEAAQHSHNRTHLPAFARSPREDVDAGTRIRIMERARYWEKNSPLAQKILDLIETNVVGTGIHPTPLSSSEQYNVASLKAWDGWTSFADLTSRQNFYTLEAVIVRAMAVDGEMFVRLMVSDNGRPRLQLIEAHRCKSMGKLPPQYAGLTDVDGVLINQFGRPEFYCFDNEDGTYAVVPALEVVHFFEPARAGQYRGLSLFHSVLTTIHDQSDLQGYEMLAAKKAASRSDVVKTKEGAGISAEDIMAGDGVDVVKVDDATGEKYYQTVLGAETVVLRPGDELEQSKSERPSIVMQGFFDYLDRRVCMGVGISYAAITDYAGNWGGAALRAAIASDNRFYSVRTSTMLAGLQRIWDFVTGTLNKTLGVEVPSDWQNVRWQPPARSTVDVGRESRAVIEELRCGIRTYASTLGEQGEDWMQTLEQRAKEEAFIDSVAKKHGVERSFIAALNVNERTQKPAAASLPDSSVDSADSTDSAASETVGDNQQAAEAGVIQDASLNGAQVQALVELAMAVSSGQLPVETAKNIARASFPLVPQAQIDGIFRSLESFKPATATTSSTEPAANV